MPSQNAGLLLRMGLPFEAKRGKTAGSKILYSMWVNNTFHHQHNSSQRWISAITVQHRPHVKVIYTQNGKKCLTDKLFQPDAASLSKGGLRWTRAGHKGHSPFWPRCCEPALPGDVPSSVPSSRTAGRTLTQTQAYLRAVMGLVTYFPHFHFIQLFYDATLTALIMQVRMRHDTKYFKYEGRLGEMALVYFKLLDKILQEEIPEPTRQACSWNTNRVSIECKYHAITFC